MSACTRPTVKRCHVTSICRLDIATVKQSSSLPVAFQTRPQGSPSSRYPADNGCPGKSRLEDQRQRQQQRRPDNSPSLTFTGPVLQPPFVSPRNTFVPNRGPPPIQRFPHSSSGLRDAPHFPIGSRVPFVAGGVQHTQRNDNEQRSRAISPRPGILFAFSYGAPAGSPPRHSIFGVARRPSDNELSLKNDERYVANDRKSIVLPPSVVSEIMEDVSTTDKQKSTAETRTEDTPAIRKPMTRGTDDDDDDDDDDDVVFDAEKDETKSSVQKHILKVASPSPPAVASTRRPEPSKVDTDQTLVAVKPVGSADPRNSVDDSDKVSSPALFNVRRESSIPVENKSSSGVAPTESNVITVSDIDVDSSTRSSTKPDKPSVAATIIADETMTTPDERDASTKSPPLPPESRSSEAPNVQVTTAPIVSIALQETKEEPSVPDSSHSRPESPSGGTSSVAKDLDDDKPNGSSSPRSSTASSPPRSPKSASGSRLPADGEKQTTRTFAENSISEIGSARSEITSSEERGASTDSGRHALTRLETKKEESSPEKSRSASARSGTTEGDNDAAANESTATQDNVSIVGVLQDRNGCQHEERKERVYDRQQPTTNGVAGSPTKKSPSKSRESGKGSTAASPTKSTKSLPKTPETASSAIAAEKKKVPMNKIQVGAAPSPNLKTVRSKIGSLDNASYRPGGGKVKIENRKLDFSKAQPKIAAKNEKYAPSGGDKKITQVKLQWNAKPKVGSLENATYKPGGGDKKIETVKLDFKDKAKPKVGSKENAKHVPGGGGVKSSATPPSRSPQRTPDGIETQKIDVKAESKVGSMDNMKHKPGGGDKKIFNDRDYLRQTGSSAESVGGSASQVEKANCERRGSTEETNNRVPSSPLLPSPTTAIPSRSHKSNLATPKRITIAGKESARQDENSDASTSTDERKRRSEPISSSSSRKVGKREDSPARPPNGLSLKRSDEPSINEPKEFHLPKLAGPFASTQVKSRDSAIPVPCTSESKIALPKLAEPLAPLPTTTTARAGIAQ